MCLSKYCADVLSISKHMDTEIKQARTIGIRLLSATFADAASSGLPGTHVGRREHTWPQITGRRTFTLTRRRKPWHTVTLQRGVEAHGAGGSGV